MMMMIQTQILTTEKGATGRRRVSTGRGFLVMAYAGPEWQAA